jgi:hypothetical protein
MLRRLLVAFLSLSVAGWGCGPTPNSAGTGPESTRAWFDAPLPGTVILPPNPCQIVGHGASPNGVAVFELAINGKASSIPSPDTHSSLVTLTRDCGVSEPGEYQLQMRVQDNGGDWSGYAETSFLIPAPGTGTAPVETEAATPNPEVTVEGGVVEGVVLYEVSPPDYHGLNSVEGAAVTLKGCGPDAIQTTGADGKFNFQGLPAGTCMVEVSKSGWKFAGSLHGGTDVLDPQYPLPLPSDPNKITPVSLIMIPSVEVGSVAIESISTDTVYVGEATCGPLEWTVKARATAPNGITAVVLFYRFEPGSSRGFQDIAMQPAGGDEFQASLNPTSVLGGSLSSDQATLQYQVVVQQKDGDTSIRTPVMADVAVQPCGRQGGSAASCSSYTDKRSCQSHGCNWTPGAGIVPTYSCQNP